MGLSMIQFKLKLQNNSFTTLDGYFRDSGHVVSYPEGIVYPLRENSCKVIRYDYNDTFKGIPVSWSLTKDKKEIIGIIDKKYPFSAIVLNQFSIEDQIYSIVRDWKKER